MPAVTPAEPHNPERYGSSNAIRRQDWRRGTHDCALHFRAWPAGLRAPPQAAAPQCGASRQTCHAGGHAGRATHTRAAREFQSPSAAKTGAVARKTARSTSTRRPLWGRLFVWGRLSSLRPAFEPALAPLPTASPPPNRPSAPSGASRQACHAGGHAGRGTQPRAVREFQAPTAAKTGAVARRTARSTSTRRAA
jgi:hypothetical protein